MQLNQSKLSIVSQMQMRLLTAYAYPKTIICIRICG
jgi:hypothetical protein